ncbi:hypothetical protein GDO81_005749 [Engystomops pustulosus]|uniref:PTPRJ transmembrane domain-containing protein n=1 Tax=Engystomops pustulosus TaxID=76066 RepID=A0AAV7CS75_ENGPU|nr:hypothetical protein GDO81_005749 [Engystomops pustulosus]
MDLYLQLGLLLLVSVNVHAQTDISKYMPVITPSISANITDKSFVLVQPQCLFNNFNTTNVWLVIALNNSYLTLNDDNLSNPVSYSSFKNGRYEYYHTLVVSAKKYPCPTNGSVSEYLIQIGSDSSESCSKIQYCNGKLRNNQTYRARFVLLKSTGVFDKTMWSEEISLRQDVQFPENRVWPSGRSGGMIVLTSILSVLLAILLVSLIVALVFGSRNICWKRTMKNEKHLAAMDFMTRSTYRSQYQNMYANS